MAEELKNLGLLSGQSNASSSSRVNTAGFSDLGSKKSNKQQGTLTDLDLNNKANIGQNGGQIQAPKKAEPKKNFKRKEKRTGAQELSKQNAVFGNNKGKERKSTLEFDQYEEFTHPSQYKNQSANHLLAFQFKDEEPSNYGVRRGGNFYGGKRKNQNASSYLTKEQYVQSSLKFVVKRDKDYLINLYDPNELVDWKDVVRVTYNMMNAQEVQCPICMENLCQMVAPKITKCGHIYCWPCILQYLAFEKERNWKRCPLCFDPIYKHELKHVQINQSNYYKPGQMIQHNLMVRGRASIVVKDKEQPSLDEGFLPTSNFPNQSDSQYHNCRILLSDKDFEREMHEKDQEILKEDMKLMQSSQELEKVPCVKEALDYCEKELTKLKIDRKPSEAKYEEEAPHNFEEKKRRHNAKQELKKKVEEEALEESSQNCYYFFQSSTGEYLFLHPVCQRIMQQQFSSYENFPLSFESQILEINYGVANMYDPEFKKNPQLNHLPNGTAYGFVEVDMSHIVSPAVYKDFDKQLSYRAKLRTKKLEKEEKYSGKVENFYNERFENYKKEAIVAVNTNHPHLRPGVVKNIFFEGNQEEVKEEQSSENNQENEMGKNEEPEVQTEEQKLWGDLGDLMGGGPVITRGKRKDTLDGVEVSLASKKKYLADQARSAEEEFGGRDGTYSCVSSMQIMDGSKKNRKKRRH